MNYFVEALKKYATFSGRARRKEYWFFTLGYVVLYFIAAILDGMMGGPTPEEASFIFTGLVALALFLPNLAVSVRRLHDTDRSGWWVLLGFIPALGALVLLVFFCLEGTQGENRFGDDPKDED